MYFNAISGVCGSKNGWDIALYTKEDTTLLVLVLLFYKWLYSPKKVSTQFTLGCFKKEGVTAPFPLWSPLSGPWNGWRRGWWAFKTARHLRGWAAKSGQERSSNCCKVVGEEARFYPGHFPALWKTEGKCYRSSSCWGGYWQLGKSYWWKFN